jgi:hypothetical protein
MHSYATCGLFLFVEKDADVTKGCKEALEDRHQVLRVLL